MKDPPSNLSRVREVVLRLGDLAWRFVLVGGSVTELLVTDRGSSSPRPTYDVHLAVDTRSFTEWNELEERLRALGFANDTADGVPACRWKYGETRLDVVSAHDR